MTQKIQREIDADQTILGQLLAELKVAADSDLGSEQLCEFQRRLGAHHLAEEELFGRLQRESGAVTAKQRALVEHLHQVLDDFCSELIQQLKLPQVFWLDRRELLDFLFYNSIAFKDSEIWPAIHFYLTDDQQRSYAYFYRQRVSHHQQTL